MKPDLTWMDDGLMTTFLAETEYGAIAYRELIEQTGAHKVLSVQRDQVISALKRAGYRIRKAQKAKPLTDEDLALLDTLEGGAE